MKIDIYQSLKKSIFYNNICIIVCIFCIICFFTSIVLGFSTTKKQYYDLNQSNVIGPIVITDKSAIYKIYARFTGKNQSNYLSVEVLDEDKDTLYELGKDFWHEEGYDSDGYWSESESTLSARLTFSEKGTYYLSFNSENNDFSNINVIIYRLKASSIPHLITGFWFLILLLIFWLNRNWEWAKDVIEDLNERFVDMLED